MLAFYLPIVWHEVVPLHNHEFMFGLFAQVLDNISGCTDGESNTGFWVWLLCLFTSSWYNSYLKRQTGKLWSATLGLILRCTKGLETPGAPTRDLVLDSPLSTVCLSGLGGFFLTSVASSFIFCPIYYRALVGQVKSEMWNARDGETRCVWGSGSLCPVSAWSCTSPSTLC